MSRILKKHIKPALITCVIFFTVSTVRALYEVTNQGEWPHDWPKELEPLRKQSHSLEHQAQVIHEIPFANRNEFEAAWPHILKIKSKGAPITLIRSPDNRFVGTVKAGVYILSPLTGTLVTPDGVRYPPGAEAAIPSGKFLRIGPPWPEDIKSPNGELPEYAVDKNGKWVAYLGGSARPSYPRRVRTGLELVVDGDIVNLNRIPLPPDAPIVDKRFVEAQKTSGTGAK